MHSPYGLNSLILFSFILTAYLLLDVCLLMKFFSFFFFFLKNPNYQVRHSSSGPDEGKLVELDDVSLTDQVILIPPRVLDYGKYFIELEVCTCEQS